MFIVNLQVNPSRGQKLKISPVQELAEKFKLNFRSPITLDEEKEFNFFKTLESHIIIVVAYGKLIPKKYLDLEGKIFSEYTCVLTA